MSVEVDYQIGRAALDWLTVVSREPLQVDEYNGRYVARFPFRLRGYVGETIETEGGGISVAENHAQDMPYLSQVTSDMAAWYWPVWAARCAGYEGGAERVDGREVNHFRCTRMDVKMDVRADNPLDAISLKKHLEEAAWGHRPPTMTAYRSDTDTLYIGAPGSPVRWRIYQKAQGIVRCEVQLRNGRDMESSLAWHYLVTGGDLADVYNAYATRIPNEVVPVDWRGGEYEVVKRVETGSKRLEWLNKAVYPALLKLERSVCEAWLDRTYEMLSKEWEKREREGGF